jgi:hypothetical protein
MVRRGRRNYPPGITLPVAECPTARAVVGTTHRPAPTGTPGQGAPLGLTCTVGGIDPQQLGCWARTAVCVEHHLQRPSHHVQRCTRREPSENGAWLANSQGVSFNDLIAECAHMPDAALQFAQGVGWVKTPEDFMPLRDRVRENNHGQMAVLTDALKKRFPDLDALRLGLFQAAGEMALVAEVGRSELTGSDRGRLRELWERLLAAH